MNWLFASGGQSSGASASASVIPLNATDPYHLGGPPRRAKKGKSRQALSPSHLPSGGLLLIRNLVLAQEELTPFLQYSPVPLLDRGECL